MLNQKIVFVLAIVVLFLACLLGGGQGFFGDVLAQLAAIGLLIACLFNPYSELKTASTGKRTLALAFIVVIIFVPLLQLYPWPASNEFAVALQHDLKQAGVDWSSGSLNKTYGAERALLGLLPGIAIFLASLQLSSQYRNRLLIGLALIVTFNIFLGFAQLAQGKTSALRLYEVTNTTEAVGFFANRNHFASLLMMCLPLSVAVTAWWAYQRASKAAASPVLIACSALFCVFIILAIAVARSRAGLLLGMLGVFLSLFAVFALPRHPGMKRVLSVVVVLGAVVAMQFGLSGIMQRLDEGAGDKTRMQMTQISIEAGKAYAPMGSGLGTFRQAYTPFEAKHESSIDHAVVNHAHNDYAELWLEAGYPGLFAIAGFWLLFIVLGVRVWWQQKQADSFDVLLSRVAWISVLLVSLHSYADYPLRTTANTAVFALLLATAIACSKKHKSKQALKTRPDTP
ncbi:MAG: O-antigen ligase family protein [Arenimonas sp.]